VEPHCCCRLLSHSFVAAGSKFSIASQKSGNRTTAFFLSPLRLNLEVSRTIVVALAFDTRAPSISFPTRRADDPLLPRSPSQSDWKRNTAQEAIGFV
jgi:hypothetical protein